MEPSILLAKALDRFNLSFMGFHRQKEAALNCLAVHQHRTGPAVACFAAYLGPGQSQDFPQDKGQRPPGYDRNLFFDPVDIQSDRMFHVLPAWLISTAFLPALCS